MNGNPWLGLVIGLLTPLVLAGETGIAARVNGTDISNFRLERHFADYLKIQGRQVGAIRSPVVYKRLKREALQQLIDKELLWQEAGRLGVTVSDAEISASLAGMKAAFADTQGFDRALADAGFDEAGYRDYLRHELAARRVLDELAEVAPPGESEVNAAYESLKPQLDPTMDAIRAKALLRQYLTAQRMAQGREEALEKLRAKGRVDVLITL
ncbi:SurA N-terminal domain-containing protein [Metapseudomonas lalkuanensis]|uniref:SurA N-terminal domain-containing protein n=1 Tax=Metapseudomonas lalkuanensis TaxID=2604832 RepID=UPI001CF27A6B|nr:SurA N-terminal domain-containing protein [Pseudomonas lalkuanensis]UCO97552.1 SurA N-terminal domain-containing protein [Pseudomonas lalkuanensis]